MTVQYVRNGDAHIAYRTVGEGPTDLIVFSPLLVSFDALDENPHTARFDRRLASFARLIEFDARGIGLSDAGDRELTPELIANDARCVLDAVGSQRVTAVGSAGTGPASILLAADDPDRVDTLVLVNAYARMVRADDYAIGYPREIVDGFVTDNIDPDVQWKAAEGQTDVGLMMPSLEHDARFLEWYERASHRAAGPGAARRYLRMMTQADVRAVLPSLSARTLVLTRSGDRFIRPRLGRFLAEHIPGARYVELPGADHVSFAGDADGLADEIEEFVTGRRSGSADRVLATLLFSDIVDSTRRAQAVGDAAWRVELDEHDARVRLQIGRYGGREVNTTGDGFVALFDSPTAAVECGLAIIASAGVEVRVGVHTGECERRGDDVAGFAVHLAARVAGQAGAGEVLVSRTVCDLVAGSRLRFVSRGSHELKGTDRPWELYSVEP